LIREITVAARAGGGDPDGNPRLRLAVEKAKAVNMPQDNIQRAIQKGTGELPGTSYEEYIYEGYGPGGVAVLLEIVTDNKNRTAPEIRKAFAKYGGNLGESGCVAWMFDKKGLIQVDTSEADEDRLLGVVLEAGAEDVRRSDDTFEVITAPKDLERVKASLTKEKIGIAEGEVTMLPQNTVKLEGKQAQQMLQLMETLEEHDDVQNVYANFDIPDEIMAAATG
jgi:YebC/PmpR family DNA-binding regulatory protein